MCPCPVQTGLTRARPTAANVFAGRRSGVCGCAGHRGHARADCALALRSSHRSVRPNRQATSALLTETPGVWQKPRRRPHLQVDFHCATERMCGDGRRRAPERYRHSGYTLAFQGASSSGGTNGNNSSVEGADSLRAHLNPGEAIQSGTSRKGQLPTGACPVTTQAGIDSPIGSRHWTFKSH